MADAVSPSKPEEKRVGSSPQRTADILLGLAAGERRVPTPIGTGEEFREVFLGEKQTPSGAEAEPTPSKDKASSTSSQRKAKAASSTAASSLADSEAGTPKKGKEGVDSDEREETSEEEEETKEEESEEEDEPPAKRAKTPVRKIKEEPIDLVAPKGMVERDIVCPRVLDFTALAQLGVFEEVREKFRNIGWEKFLDLDMTCYTELVKEFFADLKLTSRGEEGVTHVEFTLDKKKEILNPNQIACDLKVIPLDYMITDEFQRLPKAIPLMSTKVMNEKWALIGKGNKFS